MPETVDMLENALETEAKLLVKLIGELQNDDLYEFIRRIAEVKASSVGTTPADEILHVARNVKNIENALEDFYVR